MIRMRKKRTFNLLLTFTELAVNLAPVQDTFHANSTPFTSTLYALLTKYSYRQEYRHKQNVDHVLGKSIPIRTASPSSAECRDEALCTHERAHRLCTMQ